MSDLTESNILRKEDILAKSRQSNNDEGIEYAVTQGAKKGNYYATEIIGLPMLMFSIVAGQWLAVYALAAVIFASEFGDFLTKYRILRQKRYFIAAICFGLLGMSAIILFVRYIGTIQGWWG